MSELKFKQELCAFISKIPGCSPFRIENRLEPGMPDILVVREGKQAFWIEAKVKKESLNRSQEIWIYRHISKGGIVLLARRGEADVDIKEMAPGLNRKPEALPPKSPYVAWAFSWPMMEIEHLNRHPLFAYFLRL